MHTLTQTISIIVCNSNERFTERIGRVYQMKCTSNVSSRSGEIVSDLYYVHYVAPLVGGMVYVKICSKTVSHVKIV